MKQPKTATDITDEEARQGAIKLVALAGVTPTDNEETAQKKIVDFIHEHHLVPTKKKAVTMEEKIKSQVKTQLKRISKLLNDHYVVHLDTYDDTPLLVQAVIDYVLEDDELVDRISLEMCDIGWIKSPIIYE